MRTDPNICCRRCKERDMDKIEEHHIIPKSIGGKDIDGRRYLCKKCHTIWHNMLPKIIFEVISDEQKIDIRQHIKERFLEYIDEP